MCCSHVFMLSLRGLANGSGSGWKQRLRIVIRENAPGNSFRRRRAGDLCAKVTGVKLATVTRTPGRRPLYVGSHRDLSGAEFAGKLCGKGFRLAEHGDGLVIMGADEEKNPISRDYGDFGLLFGDMNSSNATWVCAGTRPAFLASALCQRRRLR